MKNYEEELKCTHFIAREKKVRFFFASVRNKTGKKIEYLAERKLANHNFGKWAPPHLHHTTTWVTFQIFFFIF